MASDSQARVPRLASTVLVLRDSVGGPEVFMVRRHEGTRFMGGAHVFPGGAVDELDHDAGESWCDGLADAIEQLRGLPARDAIGHHVAAARELFEEAGVLLAREPRGALVSLADPDMHARFAEYRRAVHAGALRLRNLIEREGLKLALDALIHFSNWVTPPIETHRFDTRFFMARLPPQQVPVHDERETTHGTWLSPAAALAGARAGAITLPPPTWTTLREIEPLSSVGEALAWARNRRVVRREPKLFERDGRQVLVTPGDPLHPQPEDEGPLSETRFVLVEGRWIAQQRGT